MMEFHGNILWAENLIDSPGGTSTAKFPFCSAFFMTGPEIQSPGKEGLSGQDSSPSQAAAGKNRSLVNGALSSSQITFPAGLHVTVPRVMQEAVRALNKLESEQQVNGTCRLLLTCFTSLCLPQCKILHLLDTQ